MKKIFNEIISTIYCKYIHISKKVNNDDFKCFCSSCKYFKECDKSYYAYINNEIQRLKDEFEYITLYNECNLDLCNYNIYCKNNECSDFCPVNMQLMHISYQVNYWNRILKYYDEK